MLGVLVVCAVLGLVGVGIDSLTGNDLNAAAGTSLTRVDPSGGSTTDPPTTSSTTTAIPVIPVIERFTLAPGEREVATVRPDRAQVTVRSAAPAGWDTTLTPVVVPDTVAVPPAPRSALDVDRMALPGPDTPVAGRAASPLGWVFANPSLYTPPQPLVFSVVARQGYWIQVLLPVRPNGTTGWLRSSEVELSTTTLRIEVSLSTRNLQVVDAATVVFDAPVSVGRSSTPTPTGTFSVTDIVPSVDPTGSYGPVALALNGYSEVMDRFGSQSVAGSPDDLAPVLAIHGTNRPDSIGRAASNGCPRLFNDDMVELVNLVPAGTPVEIRP